MINFIYLIPSIFCVIFYIAYCIERNKRRHLKNRLDYIKDVENKMMYYLEHKTMTADEKVFYAIEEYYTIPF